MHFSKAKLAKIFPGSSGACNRCAFVPADLAHTFWSCSKLTGFWKSFFKIMSEVLGVAITPCPLIAIFGVPSNYSEFSKQTLNGLAFAPLIVCRRILLHWKLPKPPGEQSGQTDLMSFLKLEKIKFSLRESTEKFYTTWQPLISYFNNVATTPTVYVWTTHSVFLSSCALTSIWMYKCKVVDDIFPQPGDGRTLVTVSRGVLFLREYRGSPQTPALQLTLKMSIVALS